MFLEELVEAVSEALTALNVCGVRARSDQRVWRHAPVLFSLSGAMCGPGLTSGQPAARSLAPMKTLRRRAPTAASPAGVEASTAVGRWARSRQRRRSCRIDWRN